ncbi:bifunctional 4-hydroxy-2-oxoglutarate aldolase/2-dehydro-3-deoxy-phosphogluconate aldolase [Kocuria koreensis]|jgi:2-dehydro-3-deoxyphosphogluconate aldolase/(4S)-4-hydroxy-2-oxoglutarate aldolase|uniref:Bifunctional 4-hydroxy-2-oxoglutarate aldolase/2-dehydro-3-deoxy-phosphogluconate aldolase n=1 Tax=Rothia koreensis TaxID=592378 RepID=A0A7K1LJN6_9MICC|nr:bifunctional 4-hydroxy-2-oxoglutarate aldolase/2-dehydro-3-deoxy-phosphogluconate aldolase [Rothia koreensis]MUN55414.1 bifunctional 4-hydroxy-2-oxoglutarate aldolase/2-dehydro-3-deoxy-phosphogluconate aldolase [Rothia koreensis]
MTTFTEQLRSSRVVAVVRAKRIPDAVALAESLANGGISILELTYTTPDVETHLRAISSGAPGTLVGAGTVLDAAQARGAVEAGARFLVTPSVIEEVAEVAREAGVPMLLGAMTPTEVLRARALGAEHVKIFPAGVVGSRFVKDLQGPFPGLSTVPSGGIDEKNARDFIDAGATAVCCGSSVVSAADVEGGAWEKITANATDFVERTTGAVPASGSGAGGEGR